MSDAPTTEELAAYLRGALPHERFDAVDRWLAAAGDESAAAALAAAEAQLPALRISMPVAPQAGPGFVADAAAGRLRIADRLGEGGTAVVLHAADRALEREVALKVLKARQPGESLERYLLREHAFLREAAITASLDHPAVPHVHDVGRCDGRPAFIMQRLDGRRLDACVAAQRPGSPVLIELLLRAVEAVAYAHSRGLVHRDLSPANILVADYGAVYVLDWGLAARAGDGGGARVGTPAWIPPEQESGAAADPRMDVYAIGCLLHLVLTGAPPARSGVVDLGQSPRGLAAVVRRCRGPAEGRYPDAAAVLSELRRWQDEGITVAQAAGPAERAWLRLRRSRGARISAAAGLALGVAAGLGLLLHERSVRADAVERLQRVAATADLGRAEAVRIAQAEVAPLLAEHPDLPEARQLSARLQTALDLLAAQERAGERQARLRGLLAHARRTGPWPDEIAAWSAALADAGLPLAGTAMVEVAGAEAAEALVWLWRAAAERGQDDLARHAAALLACGGPGPGWRALGRVCAVSTFPAHDPVAPAGSDLDAALADPGSAAVAMAVFAPSAAIDARAIAILRERPGDFWPLVAAARAALGRGDLAEARRAALVASGADPDSMFPPLCLAYEALARGDEAALAQAVGRGLRANPDHTELQALQALTLVRGGHPDDAQMVVDRIGGGHLQFHLQHRVGHAMERTVDALVAAGLRIPAAAPQLGPVAPGADAHHHHQH